MNRNILGLFFIAALSMGAAQAGVSSLLSNYTNTGSRSQTGPGVGIQPDLDVALTPFVKTRQQASDSRAAAMIQEFKDALATNGVACDATKLRPFGQEITKKRYVVEFQCPQQPNGVVAFIPLAGNTNPFEAFDCAGAARFGVACKLTKASQHRL